MPGTIIFWNIARTSGSGASSSAIELGNDLFAIQGICEPDVIVLCEAQKGTRREMIGDPAKNPRRLIGAYVAPGFAKAGTKNNPPSPGLLVAGKTANDLGAYGRPTDLRYILLHKSGLSCTPCLLEINQNRPALAFRFDTKWFIALHATSAGQATVTPQSNDIAASYEACLAVLGTAPHMIFGDLNVDMQIAGKWAAVEAKLSVNTSPPGAPFLPRVPFRSACCCGDITHRSPTHQGELDWGIKTVNDGSFNPRVIRLEENLDKEGWLALSNQSNKRRAARAGVGKRRSIVRSDDGSDSSGDDDEFTGHTKLLLAKNSDHWPIAICW